MLKLIYSAVASGAPDGYGPVVDTLRTENGLLLQELPKARETFAAPTPALAARIDAWLASRTDPTRPVVVMVHGYLFDPEAEPATNGSSPFDTVYGPCSSATYRSSWLPLVGECSDLGANPAETAIGFAYKSRAGLLEYGNAGWSNSYQYAVFDLARLAARALAAVFAHLGTRRDIRFRVLAHSLGTRTTSQALRLLDGAMPGNLERIVFLDGAEFSVDAARNFAGCDFDVFNITSRADEVLRIGAERFCYPVRSLGLDGCVIGYDGLGNNERWLDLCLGNPALAASFKAATGSDYAITPTAEERSHPFAVMGHWSCYMNIGNRALVRDLLLNDAITVARLKEANVPDGSLAPSHGRFDGIAVPPVPMTMAERHRVLDQNAGGGEGSG